MLCTICGDNATLSTTSKLYENNGNILVVINIPCHKCTNCGEVYFSGEVVKVLEKIHQHWLKENNTITIKNYQDAA